MAFFSKFTKSNVNEKTLYPWSQRKISGSSNALPRFGHAATLFDNQHFYIYGGIHTKGSKKNLFIIDTNTISASSVSTSGDIPSPRSFSTISTLGQFVLLYGGEPAVPNEIWDPHFYVLHTNTRQWSRVRTKGRLPSERSSHSTCISEDGIMYIWGGHYRRKYLNDLCAFNVKDYPSKAEWDFITYENQGPSPRSGHVSVIYDNKLYIFGGINATHLYNDLWSFDLKTHVWTQINAIGYIPPPRESCGVALVDDTIYIFGGKGLNGCLGDLCAFRIRTQRWYMFQSMGIPPSPRYGFSMTVIQNKIYIVGGDSMGARAEDSHHVFILDCNKIRYPAEEAEIEQNKSTQPVSTEFQFNVTGSSQENSRSPRLMMNYLSSTDQLINHYQREEKLNSPIKIDYLESHLPVSDKISAQPPPRPSRDGLSLLNNPTSPIHSKNNSVDHNFQKPLSHKFLSTSSQESNESALREIMTRDAIIKEMKKKEQWWRTEVSIYRKDDPDNNLMRLEDPDKFMLFQNLVTVKSDIKKLRNQIYKQTEPILKALDDAEQVRVIALEEANYYKSKYTALKSRDLEKYSLLESDRITSIERKLEEAYQEKTRINQKIKSIRQQSEHDQHLRKLAEEKAKTAQLQSEAAQESHQQALDQLKQLYEKIVSSEATCRNDALTIANLSNQLANQLSLVNEKDVSQSHIEMSCLEVANIRLRNEIASLLKTIEETKDEENQLKMTLSSKDQAYSELVLELEKNSIELELLKGLKN